MKTDFVVNIYYGVEISDGSVQDAGIFRSFRVALYSLRLRLRRRLTKRQIQRQMLQRLNVCYIFQKQGVQ